MWKKLPHSTPYFLLFTQDHGYCIYITDFINIWWVKYKENEFLSVLKNSNDDLEMENDSEFVEIGVKMLQYPENLKKLTLSLDGNNLNVSMILTHVFPIHLDMKLVEGSKEMFYEKITKQLLKTVQDLKFSENNLRFSLIKKDKEIEEYKSETDVRLAMYLKTVIFNDEEHMAKHTMYETVFGTSDVPENLLQRVLERTEDKMLVKEEDRQMAGARVKVEQSFQQVIKNEPESPVPDTLNSKTIKREMKSEPLNISPKKRFRKMLKI